jgi:hypothetical protein
MATRSKAPAPPRRRGVKIVKLQVGVPADLADAARELAAARRQSVAALHTDALRTYIEKRATQDDSESQFSMLNRKITQVSRKQDVNTAADMAMGETLGIILQVLLGGLPMPRTVQEKAQQQDQIAERMPNAIDGIAENLLTRAFMRRFMPTRMATEEDFPKPPADESKNESV